MSFKITIEEIKVVTKLVKGAFTTIDQKQEMKMYQQGEEKAVILKDVYGYAPDREEEVKTETKVFEQIIDNIDLQAVIRAINGI